MTSRTRAPDRDGFARYLDEYPATLELWRAGEAGLYRLLAALNVYPVAVQRDEAHRIGPHLATMLLHRAHHNQVGIVVSWALTQMRGRIQDADPPIRDLERVFEIAGLYWSLKNVMADVYAGTRSFEATGRRIRIPYIGNAVFEATDRLLETLEQVQSMPEGPPAEFASLREWERTEGRDVPWEGVPLAMREELRAFARSISAQQESYLAPTLDVGGFTMGEAERVLLELIARAWHSAVQIMIGCHRREVVLPAIPRRVLVGQLALTTRVPEDRVQMVVDLLTVDLSVCTDPCLTPIIPLPDGRLAPMSSLITPGAMVRNFTARLQLDPARFGKAGQLLGLLGSRTVADTLRRRLTGAEVAERVKVFRGDRSQAGDFDVVAYDPVTMEVVVFEVIWGISLDGSADVADLELRAHDKRGQITRLRTAIRDGALPRWPAGWVVPEEATYRWFILTPSVLPALRVDDAGVPVRSHQILASFRWAGTAVADMVDALLNPPPPPTALSATEWVDARYGRYDISVERLRA